MISLQEQDVYWMKQAINQAKIAAEMNEVPVGAVLISSQNECLASSHNSPIIDVDPTAHAEIKVIRQAAKAIDNYRLVDTTLYVTLEPCVMCVGSLVHSRIKRLVYGAKEYKTGAIESQFQLLQAGLHNHTIEICSGVLETECSELLSDFFKLRREQKKNA